MDNLQSKCLFVLDWLNKPILPVEQSCSRKGGQEFETRVEDNLANALASGPLLANSNQHVSSFLLLIIPILHPTHLPASEVIQINHKLIQRNFNLSSINNNILILHHNFGTHNGLKYFILITGVFQLKHCIGYQVINRIPHFHLCIAALIIHRQHRQQSHNELCLRDSGRMNCAD